MYVKAYRNVENDDPELTKYTRITGLSFAPSADLAGASIPIDEFQVDIHTDDEIEIGGYAQLYDDRDNLWASYWIIYAEHIDAYTLRLRAQSDIAILDRVTLPATYYSNTPVTTVLDDTIVRNSGATGIVVTMDYTLDSAFDSHTVTGFCPEQTARERLLWICFVIGAYVKTCFNSEIEILPIDSTEALIPMGDTYWKPTVTYNDWVTAVKAKSYAFTPGTPETTDTYVTDANGTHYIVTESEVTLQNPDAPAAAPENIVTIEGVYLVNNGNVSDILSHLSQWYFKRMQVELSAIDNAAYIPGDKVVACIDDANMVSGFINSADFAFGLQAKAKLHLTAADNRESGALTIVYKYEYKQLDARRYVLPVGYNYEIRNPYFDVTVNRLRYVYRPLNEAATGTIVAGENEAVEMYELALEWEQTDNGFELEVISVDDIYIDDGGYDSSDIGVDGTEIIPPARIEVTTPPATTIFESGQTIDYTGMVVKAYTANGDLWTDNTHPDGVIPLSELTLDYSAEYNEQSHSDAEAIVDQNNTGINQGIRDVGVIKFNYLNNVSVSGHWSGDYERSQGFEHYEYSYNFYYTLSDASAPVYCFIIRNVDSSGVPYKYDFVVVCSLEPFFVRVNYVGDYDTHDYPEEWYDHMTYSEVDEKQEIFGRYFYRTIFQHSFAIDNVEPASNNLYNYTHEKTLVPEPNELDDSILSGQNILLRYNQLCYTVLFSDITVAKPVQYDAGDGNILETSVNITITEATE